MHLIFLCTPAGGAYKNAAKDMDGLLKLEYTGLRGIRCRMGKYGEAYDSFENGFPQALKAYAPHKAVLCGKCLSKTPFQGIIFRE